MMSSHVAALSTTPSPSIVVDDNDIPRRPLSESPITLFLARLFVLVAALAAWELCSDTVVDSFYISSPSQVAPMLWTWITDGTLWYHARSTLWSAAVGFTAGGIIAVVAGYIFAQWKFVASVLEPFITAIYGIPKIALIPLLIVWFGLGFQLQVICVAIVTFFLMFYNTFFGIREVNHALIDQMRVMGANRWNVAVRAKLPSALVWVVAGLKITVPQALIAVVVAEMLASNQGLGYLLTRSANQFNTTGVFAAIIVLVAVSFTVDRVVSRLTRRAMQWKEARS
ncbi:ABC transporter permease [Rhodococcus sp. USK10]|uniref:ABC transporter permease n=1 Tax=Rhodococcus sp. USK10 TaxID=2789739 RepID=UPI001C6057D7|nr:ABC transporter permease [Rhodococcus sp. USK10]QYB07331.1 ABC transporter permease [Rhodococcus sp. USK10]